MRQANNYERNRQGLQAVSLTGIQTGDTKVFSWSPLFKLSVVPLKSLLSLSNFLLLHWLRGTYCAQWASPCSPREDVRVGWKHSHISSRLSATISRTQTHCRPFPQFLLSGLFQAFSISIKNLGQTSANYGCRCNSRLPQFSEDKLYWCTL